MAFATILPRARRSRERSNFVNSYGLRLGAGFISRARCMCSIRSQAVKARPGGGAWTSRRPTEAGRSVYGRLSTVRFDGYGVRVLPYSRVRLSEFAGESRACGDAVRRGGGGRTERTRPGGPGGAQATTRHVQTRRRVVHAPVQCRDRRRASAREPGPPGSCAGARAAYLLDSKARTG